MGIRSVLHSSPKKEQRFIEADASHRLIQKQGDEQPGGYGQNKQDKPYDVVLQRSVEPSVIQQVDVMVDADIDHVAKSVPFMKGNIEGLEDWQNHIDQKKQKRRRNKECGHKAEAVDAARSHV